MKSLICVVLIISTAVCLFSEIVYFNGETAENHYELHMFNSLTGVATCLTDLNGFISGFDFSVSSDKIYFGLLSTDKNGLYELVLKTGEINPVLVDGYKNRQPCVIDEDTLLFVSYRKNRESLFLLDLKDAEVKPFIVLEGYEFSPVISPNKQLLAFVRSIDTYEHDGQIYLYNRITGEMSNLSGKSTGDYSPSFSPDSQMIIFSSYRERGQQAIFEMNIEKGSVRKVTPFFGTTDRFPVYDQSGEWVYFTTLKHKYQLARMKRDGSDREIFNVFTNDLNIGTIIIQ